MTMQILITVATDNAAFEDDRDGETVRLIREVADTFARHQSGLLRDSNGNTVGEFRAIEHNTGPAAPYLLEPLKYLTNLVSKNARLSGQDLAVLAAARAAIAKAEDQ